MDDSGDMSLVKVVPYVIAWQGVYWTSYALSSLCSESFSKLSAEDGEKGYWAASIVSTVHSVVVGVASVAVLIHDPSLLGRNAFGESTTGSIWTCYVFLGYILSDFVVALYYNTRWSGWEANLAHHAMVTIVWAQVATGHYAQGLSLLMQIMEFTSPFINARWFLLKTGLKNSRLYIINGMVMLVLWFIFRIAGYLFAFAAFFMQWHSFQKAQLPIFNQACFLFCFIAGFLLQAFWFYKMARGAYKVLFASPDPKAVGEGETIELTAKVSSAESSQH
eukprot:TRINITY_DN17288_c0_g1_i1.p1 TRINITY_DN17288_c0_g1~~TRINITY_DN17288_c0_g1_i1.p1  ORF type:complete len:277 (-),score=24.26 TRINITY_DN17288_c0_g1_i1:584-1414(-)